MNHTPTPWTNNGDCLTAADGERYLLYFPVDNHARMAQSTDPQLAARGKALLREDEANAAFITRACNAHEALVKALTRADQLNSYALGKFDWGRSPLDAKAIALLNEVPGEVRVALKLARGE